jgi:predicted AAA+ superfamily ATPase
VIDPDLAKLLNRDAEALERLAPAPPPPPDLSAARLHVWRAADGRVLPCADSGLDLDLLKGVEAQKRLLAETVARFADGLGANHALLWGARGAGKSSLVKAVVTAACGRKAALKLVEIDRDDIAALPRLFDALAPLPFRIVVFCDDLSFEAGSDAAKSLKSAVEGGVRGAPGNVLILATSNRRHLAPERRSEADGPLSAAEDAEETVSVSDRFGLWIGFPPMTQAAYLEAVRGYAAAYGLDHADLDRKALQWAQRRGGRSGRVAAQFIRERAGEEGRPAPL